jgi:Zn-finger nucleic acid-binding protein
MNVPEALHCSGCGYALGLEPIYGHSQYSCPSCPVELARFRAPAGSLYDCGRCGGQFVEHALLRELLERREIAGALFPRKPRKSNPLDQPVVYLKCPACRTLMNRNNFGGSSGIIVDVCTNHGLWFDAGELPQVLKFVEDGGLARAKRQKAEAAKAKRDAALSTGAFSLSSSSPRRESDLGVFEALASVGLGLLELLSS